MKKTTFLSVVLLLLADYSLACTSLIISSRATADGRSVMYKHRDTNCLDNRVEYFRGPNYAFIGLTNRVPTRSGAWASYKGGEVWSGMNEAGFCIMNTATYNYKDDPLSPDSMDCEGLLMYEALGCCATVADFRLFLQKHPKPLLVETNFGVIDAQGGASYFEVNNFQYVEYNVNEEPSGYRIQTNFAFAGRPQQREGVERYLTASDILSDYTRHHEVGTFQFGHDSLIRHLSRSYRHSVLGYPEDYCPASGITVDQDFIPRRSTSAVIVFEGVKPHENPRHTVMWTSLGYPATAPMMPLLVLPTSTLPDYIAPDDRGHSRLCDHSLWLKQHYIFPDSVSNGKRYLHIDAVQQGIQGRPALKQCAQTAEQTINGLFDSIYRAWMDTDNDSLFYSAYQQQWPLYEKACHDAYRSWQ